MTSRKFILFITTAVCLLPMILALIIYNDLPDRVVMQWKLEGEPNWDTWNKTHRLAGFLWTIGGVIFITFGFLPLVNITGLILIISLSALLAIVPISYSYLLYKKKSVDTE